MIINDNLSIIICKSFPEKTYENEKDEIKRKMIFMKKLKKINEHNARYERGEESFTMALNHLSDLVPIYLFEDYGRNIHKYIFKVIQSENKFLIFQFQTQEEYKKLNGYRKGERRKGSTFMRPFNVNIPDKIDWRENNYVTPIKDQVTKQKKNHLKIINLNDNAL